MSIEERLELRGEITLRVMRLLVPHVFQHGLQVGTADRECGEPLLPCELQLWVLLIQPLRRAAFQLLDRLS